MDPYKHAIVLMLPCYGSDCTTNVLFETEMSMFELYWDAYANKLLSAGYIVQPLHSV